MSGTVPTLSPSGRRAHHSRPAGPDPGITGARTAAGGRPASATLITTIRTRAITLSYCGKWLHTFHGRGHMFGTRKLASRGILAAGLAGLAMLAAAPAASAAPAAAGPAAPSSYSTWSAAQKAAGFALYAPKYTAGLKRTNKISVTKCEVTGKTRFRDVFAQWGGKTFLALDQNNSGGACSNFGAAKSLGTYTSG